MRCPTCFSLAGEGAYCETCKRQLRPVGAVPKKRAAKGANPYLHGVVDRRFRVDALIGQGFTGEVFVAFDVVADRRVALRIIHSHVLLEPGLLATFDRDYALLRDLADPHAVEVYAFGRLPDGAPYVASELMEGLALHAAIASTAPMPWTRALDIVAQLCEPLDRAHQLGFLHRRITPAKIFLDEQARVRPGESGDPYRAAPIASDFARLEIAPGAAYRAPSPDSQLVKPRIGHVDYMAPEVLGGDPVDQRCDIFSLGCILYEMVTGIVPFANNIGIANRLLAYMTTPLALPSSRRGVGLPTTAESIIMRCLAPRPWERYENALALRDAIRAVLPP